MAKLRYYTVRALDELRRSIEERLDWYYKPSGESPEPPGGFRESRLVEAPDLADRLAMNDDAVPSSTDPENAAVVYEALSSLTPHQASMERVWTWLCHCDCPQYVAWRWLSNRPDDPDNAVRKVANHFFVRGNRTLIRDNGISRLWWLGKIAHDVDPDDPRRFLDLLLYRQDVRSALIERPAISMNQGVLQVIYRTMRKHAPDGPENSALFKRKAFRSWMVALNRRGGVILLDALPNNELAQLVNEEAERAVANALTSHG